MFVMSKGADWPMLKAGHAIPTDVVANRGAPTLSLVDNSARIDHDTSETRLRFQVNGRASNGFGRGVMIGGLLVLPFWLILGWYSLAQGGYTMRPVPVGQQASRSAR